ncbi:MAG: hypothetical protein AABW47_01100 [Nanoarchaeota archaeon]
MKKKVKKEKVTGRKLALTIILGVFIAIMVITLFNLIVTYFYESPEYNNFCRSMWETSPIKYDMNGQYSNCTFSKTLQEQVTNCSQENGIPIYDYDDKGCSISLKECNFCNKKFDDSTKVYNRNTFFVYALIGFVLIVLGLFVSVLLIQIIALPAGAFLVIEAAIKNFDDKLYVIITFSLLIVAAIYIALKKLR